MSDRRKDNTEAQLASIRGLISDATKDTVLWLQADPSTEERAHVLAMQEQLADLDRIIERRMEGRRSPSDGRQWSETVAEVLSRLDKAREVRGNIVGKDSTRGLARLAERLPKRLPGLIPAPVRPVSTAFTVTQAPAPPTSVGGLGITHTRDSKASQVPHDPPIYFPSDLWPRTNVILLEAQRKFPHQTEPQTLDLCRHIISKMTPLFCEAVKAGKMKAGAVVREKGGGMEDLLHSLLVYNDDGPKSGFSSLSDQAYRLGQTVRRSDEWLALAKAIADVQVETQHNGTGANRLRTDGKQTEEEYADAAEKTGLHRGSGRSSGPRALAKIDWNQGFEWKERDATESSTSAAERKSKNAMPSNTQEAYIDRAIASRNRMLESFGMPDEARNTNLPPALDAQKSRALLGIELARLEHLRRGVWKKFFDEARIPDVVKTEWQSALSMRKMPDSGVDLGLTFALTKEYEKAISRASAQLADLLATAAGSRINQAQLREAIWRECLDFAYQLGQWDAFATWVHRAVHIGWQALDADGQPSLTLDRESEQRLEERRKFFEGRIGMYSQEWLSAIDEAIDLRLTVSVAHTVNALDLASAAKAIAAEPKVQQPQLTPRELKVWEVIKRGVKGLEYCRELGNARIAPLQSGIWKGCPRKYESAYRQGEPWRHRIQDEKSKIRRKAELAGLAKLVGE